MDSSIASGVNMMISVESLAKALVSSLSGSSLKAAAWSTWAIALLACITRVIFMLKAVKKHSVEHYLAIAAFITMTACMICALVSFEKGKALIRSFEKPIEEGMDSRDHMHKTLKVVVMFYVVLYPTSLWISKLSVLFFSRALVRGLSQYRVQFWSLFALVMGCYVAYMVTVFTPVNMPACYTNFNMTLLNHESHSLKIVWKIQTVLDIISDLLAMVIPIYVLPNIQRNIYAKLSAFAMFALGFIIIIFSGVRLHVSLQGFDKEFPTVNSAVHILTWSQVQAAISSIVANLPAARGLWMYLRTERKKRSTSGKISYLTATLSSIVSGKTASYAGADRVAHALPLRPPPAIATRSHPGSKESLSKHGIALSPMLPPGTSLAQSRASSTDESSATLGPGTTVEQSQHKKIWKRSSICITSNSLADSAGIVGPNSSIGRGSDQRRRSLESAETSPAAWNEELKTNV